MASARFKYPGDAAFRRLLERYGCPTPFHVVRMRFLGEIASLDFAASPTKTIESFWDGDLPVFEGEKDASAFYQAMLSLWNRMARHQNGVLVKLVKPKSLRQRDDIAGAFRMRAEEIGDGFLRGFSGGGETPMGLEEAVRALNESAERFAEAAARLEGPQSVEDDLSLDDHRRLLATRTRETEALLTQFIGASMALRKRRMAVMSEIDDRILDP